MLSSVYGEPGLSLNIFGMGGKLPVQRGFFKNPEDDSLPALRFLVGLYNFCKSVVIFSLI